MSGQNPLDFKSTGYIIFDNCLKNLLLLFYILMWCEASCSNSDKPSQSSESYTKIFYETTEGYE